MTSTLPSGPEETDSGLDEMSHSESSPKIMSTNHSDSNTLASEDTEAGPDIAEDDFQPASEVFKDPNAFDFLSQHGQDSTNPALLARQSLYVKFDPLISGRPSLLQQNNQTNHAQSPDQQNNQQQNEEPNDKDLIAMQSPSPRKTPAASAGSAASAAPASPAKAVAAAASSSSASSPARTNSAADPRQHQEFQVMVYGWSE